MPTARSGVPAVLIVIDTNIALSGFLWGGPPRLILDAARNNLLTLVTSDSLLDELRGILGRPKFARMLLQIGTTPGCCLPSTRSWSSWFTPRPCLHPLRATQMMTLSWPAPSPRVRV